MYLCPYFCGAKVVAASGGERGILQRMNRRRSCAINRCFAMLQVCAQRDCQPDHGSDFRSWRNPCEHAAVPDGYLCNKETCLCQR